MDTSKAHVTFAVITWGLLALICVSPATNAAAVFRCADGTEIPQIERCDGVEQCADLSDEAGCTNCTRNEFRCDGERCLARKHICDKTVDCVDMTDERNCGWTEGKIQSEPYYGKHIGKLVEFAHHIRGTVYAVDENTLYIKGFSYDGTGPDAFFWVGNSPRPSPEGYIIPYPPDYTGNDPPVLRAYNNTDVILRLPMGKRIRDILWLSVWCRRFTEPHINSTYEEDNDCVFSTNSTDEDPELCKYDETSPVNFGEVFIPRSLEVPKPRVLPEFKRLAHGLRSGNISILDAKTFYIPNLNYDGAAPDAHFWVGNGTEPTQFGMRVANEMGSMEPLRGYQGEDIEIQLPGNLTVYDIDWLAMWCIQYRHNFGHVLIPKDLDIPPALGQTKITPGRSKGKVELSKGAMLHGIGGWFLPLVAILQPPWWYNPTTARPPPAITTNCKEFLDGRLLVRWEMQGDLVQISMSARLRNDQYMAFGLSGAQGRPQMVGADVTVAFYNHHTAKFHAEDYYMSHPAQCDGTTGVCPDERIGGRNDVKLVSGELHQNVTTIVFTRPLQTNEPVKDRAIPAKGEVNVIAAFGPLNSRMEANAHSMTDKTRNDVRIDFSSTNDASCVASLYDTTEDDKIKPWPVLEIIGTTVFNVTIGPTGGKRGYTPITGHPSWGIAWWINGLLIPEIYVERGQTYTFLVQGGVDATNPAHFHPFYITDSIEGGYGQKSEAMQKRQTVYAGVEWDEDGDPHPTAAGRYCEWEHKTIDRSTDTETFVEYVETLRLNCDEGDPAVLNWTVPMDAPDLLYYQCYTHNNLGWRIRVVHADYYRSPRDGFNIGYVVTPSLLLILSLLLSHKFTRHSLNV